MFCLVDKEGGEWGGGHRWPTWLSVGSVKEKWKVEGCCGRDLCARENSHFLLTSICTLTSNPTTTTTTIVSHPPPPAPAPGQTRAGCLMCFGLCRVQKCGVINGRHITDVFSVASCLERGPGFIYFFIPVMVQLVWQITATASWGLCQTQTDRWRNDVTLKRRKSKPFVEKRSRKHFDGGFWGFWTSHGKACWVLSPLLRK